MTQDFTKPGNDLDQDRVMLQKLHALNTVGTISYILHLIVALVIDLVKRSEAVGTWHASHFHWRIRTVVIAALLYAVTAPLWILFIFPGWIAWGVISIWFLYRIVSGLVRMNRGLPMEFAA